MNTVNMQGSFTLIAPDMVRMGSSWKALNAQIVLLKLEFLPVMAEKLPYLRANLSTADSQFRGELTNITASLDTSTLSSIDSSQQKVNTDSRLTDEQRQQATDILNDQRDRVTTNMTTAIANGARAMANATDGLDQLNLKLPDTRLPDTLQRQIDKLTERDTGLHVQLGEITEDRRALDETIKNLEKYTLIDVLKEQLPTPDELELLGAAPSEIALIQAGLNRLAKILDKLNSAITYFDLTEQRDRLRTDYNKLLDESRGLRTTIGKLKDNIEELTELARAAENKTAWVEEARKVYRSLNDFLKAHDQDARLSPAFTQSIDQLKTYIESFYKIYREL